MTNMIDWKNEIEKTQLNGTEKQVKWALDLRKGMLTEAENMFNHGGADNDLDKAHQKFNLFFEMIAKVTSAVWFIDHRFDYTVLFRHVASKIELGTY